MYDSLYGLATRSTHPRLTQRTVKTGTSIYQTRPTSTSRNDHPTESYDSTDLSYPQRSSSCIQRLDRPQLLTTIVQLHSTTRPTSAYSHQISSCISTTRPTSATLIEHPAEHIYDSTIPAIDITHLAEDPNTTATDFTHTFVIPTINGHFCCICYLTFVPFIVFGCHYSHALNLNRLRGRHAYRLRNSWQVAIEKNLIFSPIFSFYFFA